jgi:hypothetical protein
LIGAQEKAGAYVAPTLGLRAERDRQAILKMTYLIAV